MTEDDPAELRGFVADKPELPASGMQFPDPLRNPGVERGFHDGVCGIMRLSRIKTNKY